MFTADSQIVKSYILLIKQGLKTLEEVPDLYNLREVVQQCLGQ
jgi:predicted nuclease with TOPRIM domain